MSPPTAKPYFTEKSTCRSKCSDCQKTIVLSLRDPAGVVAISQNNFASCTFSGEYGTFLIRLPRRLRSRWRRRSLTDAAYPLRVRALRSVYRTPAVGRDHWARRCRNYQIRTNSFVSTVCRFADGWGMPHPYSRLSQTLCRAGRARSFFMRNCLGGRQIRR